MSNELIRTYMNMEDISDDIFPSDSKSVDKAKDQMRIFLVAQARKELERIIKLTATLDKLQEKYQSKIDEYLENHDDESAIQYLPSMIDTITKCMERSNSIISQITGNDKIMNFQFVSNNSTNTINIDNSNSTVVNLEDPTSRMKVRDTVKSILVMMNNADNVDS